MVGSCSDNIMRLNKLFRLIPSIKSDYYKYWNRFYFRMLGIEYGKNMNVNNKVYITGNGKITIGNDFRFSSGDGINPICRNIRGEFRFGTKDSIIEIGNNVGISSACIWARERITIGDNVNIGGDCIIMDTDVHSHNYVERRKGHAPLNGKYKIIPSAPIVIEEDVWLGARCMVLKGVHIGARSIIAAGSVVIKDIPADVIAGGNPCKVIKRINEDIIIKAEI